jgi:hypothetical protein
VSEEAPGCTAPAVVLTGLAVEEGVGFAAALQPVQAADVAKLRDRRQLKPAGGG